MLTIFIDMFPVGIQQGLMLSLVALGIMIPFRILDFPDLTAEGSYPLGGILCACLLTAGLHSTLAMITAVVASGCIGILTAFIHLRYNVNTLLAGIILSTMLYSVNLRLMAKPNVSLFDTPHLFSTTITSMPTQLLFLLSINIVIILLLLAFFATDAGLKLRSVGLNPQFSKQLGIKVSLYIILGLFIGNALCGLGGNLMVQAQGYADINMGVGIVIHALAALMIGESLLGHKTLTMQLLSPLVGALIYQQIQGIALALGLAPTDLKFLTGAIVIAVLAIRRRQVCQA